MASTYKKAPNPVLALAKSIIEEHHPDLATHGVRFDILMAYADRNEKTGEQNGYALTPGGYRALGIAKINNAALRALGNGDATIILDGDKWDGPEAKNGEQPDSEELLHDDQKAALLDHQLQKIAVKLDEREEGEGESEPKAKLDDYGRPKLKIRKFDVCFGGFVAVALRHREASIECGFFATVYRLHAQTFFPFMGQQELPIEEPPVKITAEAGGNVAVTEFTRDMKRASRKQPVAAQ